MLPESASSEPDDGTMCAGVSYGRGGGGSVGEEQAGSHDDEVVLVDVVGDCLAEGLSPASRLSVEDVDQRVVHGGQMGRGTLSFAGDAEASGLLPPSLHELVGREFIALRTNGDGACSLHGAFGSPNAAKEFYLPAARDKAVALMGPTYEALSRRVHPSMELQALAAMLWTDFAIPCGRIQLGRTGSRTRSPEQVAFWDAMAALAP